MAINCPDQLQELFPSFPPEIRNMIYAATLTPTDSISNPATSQFLPFQQKVYTCSHTTVYIIPSYQGLPSLISLQALNYVEAHEYLNYILNTSAVSLHIGVHFKGNSQTFNQSHWDAKHVAHLKALLKKHSWLANVTNYDVQILWEPQTLADRAKPKNEVGCVAQRMVDVLTSTLSSASIKRKTGEGVVKAGLHIADYAALQNVTSPTKMRLHNFLADTPLPHSASPRDGVRTRIREIRLSPAAVSTASDKYLPKGFEPLPGASTTKPLLVQSADAQVAWTPWVTQGDLVCALTTERDGVMEIRRGSDEPGFKEKWRLPMGCYVSLSGECGNL